jgi:hypothetical protein
MRSPLAHFVRKKKEQRLPCLVARGDKTSKDKIHDKGQEEQKDALPPAEGNDDGWTAVLSPVLAVGGFLSSMVSPVPPQEDFSPEPSPEEPSNPPSRVGKKKSSSLVNLNCSDAQVSPTQKTTPNRKDSKNHKRREGRGEEEEEERYARFLKRCSDAAVSPTLTPPNRKDSKNHERREGRGEEEERYARFLKRCAAAEKSERFGKNRRGGRYHAYYDYDDCSSISSCSSGTSSSYQQSDDDASFFGSVSTTSSAGSSTTSGGSISVSSETSSEADSEFMSVSSQDENSSDEVDGGSVPVFSAHECITKLHEFFSQGVEGFDRAGEFVRRNYKRLFIFRKGDYDTFVKGCTNANARALNPLVAKDMNATEIEDCLRDLFKAFDFDEFRKASDLLNDCFEEVPVYVAKLRSTPESFWSEVEGAAEYDKQLEKKAQRDPEKYGGDYTWRDDRIEATRRVWEWWRTYHKKFTYLSIVAVLPLLLPSPS